MCGALRGRARRRTHACTGALYTHTHTHTNTLEKETTVRVYLGVVDFGDEREGVLPGLPDVLDGQLHRGLDALADAAHQGRLVHGHKDHDGQVFPVPGEPAVVLAVFGAVVAHLGQGRVQQQGGEEQGEHPPAAAVPPGCSHATVQGDQARSHRVPPPLPHCLGIAEVSGAGPGCSGNGL